ncbi:MAG TPA: hypothetical protein VGM83_04585 [Devosiaceae bacterium]|jgi:hypothetical protein
MPVFRAPYFDNAEVELEEDDEGNEPGAFAPHETPEGAAALRAFLALTPADRMADSRHVFAYYADFREAVGGEDWLDEEMGIPETASDIWDNVTPGPISVTQGYDDRQWYVVMEAECAWEAEHGLMMVWHNGTRLTKVGGYDGHVSNSDAFADEKLSDVVYAAIDRKYTTYL